MSKELKSCEHNQTIVVDNSLAEWCEDCGAFRIKTLNPWRGSEWYYPNTRPAAKVPSEIEIMAAINKAGFDLGSVKGLDIARQIRALLAEGK